jgi:hypothetical protein
MGAACLGAGGLGRVADVIAVVRDGGIVKPIALRRYSPGENVPFCAIGFVLPNSTFTTKPRSELGSFCRIHFSVNWGQLR